MLATALHLADRPVHIPHVVQCIEDTEDVDAVCSGAFNKAFEHIVCIMPIPNQVLPPQQHLQFCLGHRGAERPQSLPGIFLQKTQAGVKGGTAPDLQRPKAYRVEFLGNRQHVLSAHPGRQKRLMSVAQRDIGDQDGLTGGRLYGELVRSRFRSLGGLELRTCSALLHCRFLESFGRHRLAVLVCGQGKGSRSRYKPSYAAIAAEIATTKSSGCSNSSYMKRSG